MKKKIVEYNEQKMRRKRARLIFLEDGILVAIHVFDYLQVIFLIPRAFEARRVLFTSLFTLRVSLV